MGSCPLLLCAVALMIASANAGRVTRGSGSYSSSSSSASSSSGSIYFGDPGQAFSNSGGFATGGLGNFGTGPHTAYSSYSQNDPDLLTRSGFVDSGSTGTKGVFSSSSSKVDSDGRIHYSVQAGRF